MDRFFSVHTLQRTSHKLALAGLALLPLSLLACGDDGDGGGITYSSEAEEASFSGGGGDVADDTQAQDLTTEQREALCMEYEEYFTSQLSEQEIKSFACTFAGFFTAAFSGDGENFDVQICEQVRSECLTQPLEEDGADTGEGDCAVEDFNDCTATVAEMEACAQEQVQQFKDLAASFRSCSSIDPNTEVSLGGEGELGPACQVLQDKCPEAFQAEEEDFSQE